jgi:hypothetical protein
VDSSKIHASVLDSEGEETHGIMRFHLNSGQTSTVNHTQERGGDTIALPHSLGIMREAKRKHKGALKIPGLLLALKSFLGHES